MGDVFMESMVSNSDVRNGLVAGAIGLVGGLGGGIATMAGPQAFPKAPLWIWEMLFWVGIFLFVGAAAYLLYEYVVRPRRLGKPKVDPLQIIAFTAAVVLAGAILLQIIRGPGVPAKADISADSVASTKEHVVKPEFMKNQNVAMQFTQNPEQQP